MKGARIGVQARTGNNPVVDKVLEQAIAVLKAQGADVVDPAPIETAGQLGMNERDVLQYEFKADLNAYLAAMPANVKVRTLADLDRKSTRLNSSHRPLSRMPSSA